MTVSVTVTLTRCVHVTAWSSACAPGRTRTRLIEAMRAAAAWRLITWRGELSLAGGAPHVAAKRVDESHYRCVLRGCLAQQHVVRDHCPVVLRVRVGVGTQDAAGQVDAG